MEIVGLFGKQTREQRDILVAVLREACERLVQCSVVFLEKNSEKEARWQNL